MGGVSDFEGRYSGVLEQIKRDIALGKQLGINGTPSFFINGVRYDGMTEVEELLAALTAERV